MSTDSGFRNVSAERHADLCRRFDELNRKLDHVIAQNDHPMMYAYSGIGSDPEAMERIKEMVWNSANSPPMVPVSPREEVFRIPPEFLRLYDVARIVNATTAPHGPQAKELAEALAACHPVVANDPSSWRQQPKDSHA